MNGPGQTIPSDLANIPPAPRTPSPNARKLIFAYAGTQKVMLIVGAFFLGIGLALSIPMCWGVPVDIAIGASHKVVDGTVLDARLQLNTTVNDEHPTKIRFSYRVQDREHTSDCSTRNPEIIEAAQPGSTIPIQVSTLVPAWARLLGTTYAWAGYFGLTMLIFPVIGAAIIGFAIRSNRREIRAFRHGLPIMARVVFSGEATNIEVNNRHPFVVKWEFKVNGEIYSGSLTNLSLLAIEDLMNRDELPVLYDESNPRINTAFVP